MAIGWCCPCCGEVTTGPNGRSGAVPRGRRVQQAPGRFGPWFGAARLLHEGGAARARPPILRPRACCSQRHLRQRQSTVSYLCPNGTASPRSMRLDPRLAGASWGARSAWKRRRVDAGHGGGHGGPGRSAVIAHVILSGAGVVSCPPGGTRYRPSRGGAMPPMDTLLERNRTRDCWPQPTPEYWVHKFVDDLRAGPESVHALFYDNSRETADETAQRLWELLRRLS